VKNLRQSVVVEEVAREELLFFKFLVCIKKKKNLAFEVCIIVHCYIACCFCLISFIRSLFMLESCNATLSFNVYFLKTHALEACSATWLMLENCLTFVCVLG